MKEKVGIDFVFAHTLLVQVYDTFRLMSHHTVLYILEEHIVMNQQMQDTKELSFNMKP